MAKQPGKFKLADAVKSQGEPIESAADAVEGRPGDAREPQDAQLQQNNANVHPGHRGHLIDVGRAQQTAGRQSPQFHEKHGD